MRPANETTVCGFLLSGNTGRLDLGLEVSMRKTGEQAALGSMVEARIRVLETELEDMASSLRGELETLRVLAESSARKSELVARKLHLTEEVWRSLAAREQTGLAGVDAVLGAEADLLRTRAQHRHIQAESRTRWFHLLAACGLGRESSGVQLSSLGLSSGSKD